MLWRALEEKWERQGFVVKSPTPDRELKKLYEIFADFNSESEGVTEQDYVECRELIQQHVQIKRRNILNRAVSVFDEDFK